MTTLAEVLASTSDLVWGPWTLVVIFSAGLLLSFETRFVQLRELGAGLKHVVRGAMGRDASRARSGDITPFQALTIALSATLGNGNVAGVATAIAIGGPGAAFWMWLVAPVGMATKYAECALAVRYRRTEADGRIIGGPMSYLADGLGLRRLALFFAVAAVFGGLGAGNLTQANSAALVLYSHFGVPKLASGVVMAILLWLIVVGGIQRIAASAERLVPAMTIAYLVSALLVLALHWREIPSAMSLIIESAFNGTAAAGGFAGATMARAAAYGFRRGVVSSEAGVGSAAIAHASARAEPHQQGVVAMMGVFIDTLVVSSTTALVIVSTGTWSSGLISSEMTAEAFGELPGGALIVAAVSAIFGFTTMLGWAYYTEQAVRYVFGALAAKPWQWIYCALAAAGAVFEVKPLWDWSDIFFGLMVLPNIIGLVGLRRVVRDESTRMIDTIIRHGRVIDGTGASAVDSDVLIGDGEIVALEPSSPASGERELDARGKIVCPGFIDIHSHSDFALLANRTAESAVAQGVTTLVTGNCGHGPAPKRDWDLTKRNTVGFSESWNIAPAWTSFGEYLEALFAPGLSVNVAPLVPHGTLRLAVMGHAPRAGEPRELEAMKDLVAEAMSSGAAGLSSGLEYSPGCYSDEDELAALAEVAAKYDGIYASHIRNRGDDFDEAVNEAINICRRAGLRGQLSHLAPRPYAPPGMFERVLAAIDDTDVELAMDTFPDAWGPGPLVALLPPFVYEGDASDVIDRLRSPSVKDACRHSFDEPMNYLLRLGGFDRLFLSCSKAFPELVGKSFAEIFEHMRLDPVAGIFEILLAEGSDFYNVLLRHIYANEADLDRLLSHPACSLGSDGVTAATSGPTSTFTMNRSSYGYTARFIREHVLERRRLSLEEAIRKMTSLPARSAAIDHRGTLETGMAADVVIFDAEAIRDESTDARPNVSPSGIETVLVNGEIVFDGAPTSSRPGRLAHVRP